ncbi:MAG TPA: hypothetical protein VLE89_02990 [Chlamydiales bacterium]|nr:hypothetical protein [Chlamydiales bacterium]
MFKRPTFCFIALSTFACLFAYRNHVQIHPQDAPIYQKLSQESTALRSRHALERHPARQKREGVQKDIWVVNGNERLHFRLKSAYSHLTVAQKKDKVEATEELKQIDCWVQDEIDTVNSLQQIRTLTADEGIYYFPSHRFLAQSVNLAFFRLAGTELPSSLFPEKPFLTGVAREVTFAATCKTPTFTAYHLRAELDPERGFP